MGNREAVFCLEEAPSHAQVDPETLLAEVRAFRDSLGSLALDDATLQAAKSDLPAWPPPLSRPLQ